MADRWLYTHANSVHGPVTHEKLEQLATIGEILPTDLIWPEGDDPRRGMEALSVLSVEAFGSVLAEVDKNLTAPSASAPTTPDWLKDVQAAAPKPPAPRPVPMAKPIAKAPKPAARPAPAETPDVELVEDEEEEEEDEGEEEGFSLTRRDLLMFALGGASVGLAAGIGFLVATRSQRAAKEENE